MKRILIVLLTLTLLAVSCGAEVHKTKPPVTSLEWIATNEKIDVFKFRDGIVICYIAETGLGVDMECK